MEKTVLQQILEQNPDKEYIKADGFDEAVIGSTPDSRLIYDRDLAIRKLIRDFTETNEESPEDIETMAVEYFEFNVEGAHGDGFPIWADIGTGWEDEA